MLENLRELSRKNKLVNFLLSPFFLSKRLFGISHPKNNQQFVVENFNTFYKYFFEYVKEGHLTLSVSDFMGDFSMDAHSDILRLFLKYRQYEPDMAALVRKYLNSELDVIDVGANVGLFTVLFAKLIANQRKVLSVEPTPRALELLRQNIGRNECKDKVMIFDGVATSEPGTYSINLIDGKEEYSSLGPLVHYSTLGYMAHSMEVRGETIDNLVKRYHIHPGFIKVDVEGAEYLVFKGAMETLKQYKPVILFELSDTLLTSCGSNSRMVTDLLETAGYKIIDNNHPDTPISHPFDGTVLALPQVVTR